MGDSSDVAHKIIIVLFLPLIAVPVHIRNLVHNKMNVDILGVAMYSIYNLILWRVMLDDCLGKLIGLFCCHPFLPGKT